VTFISVRLVERGDGEDGVSMPGLRAEVSPSAEVAAYATDASDTDRGRSMA
jgi:hypothetical protein